MTSPQVVVTANGVEGTCQPGACDFAYVADTASVGSVSHDSEDSSLTITGTGFPTDNGDYESILFGGADCTVTAASETEITCDLEGSPMAGAHLPKIMLEGGLIAVDSDADEVTVGLTITSDEQTFSNAGGQQITIDGTGFPRDLASA